MTDENAAPVKGDPAPAAEVQNTTPETAATPPAEKAPPAPSDWATRRTEYAKGDEKLLARLSRYSSEKDVVDAMIAAQNKISSGGLKAPLPDDPSPEEMAAWRAENGVPLTPKDYGIKAPEGADEAQLGEFLNTAHELNMTPAQVEKLVAWRTSVDQQQAEQRAEMDAKSKDEGTEALRADWGSEYKLNVNLITGLLDGAPEGLKDQIMGGRLADGNLIGNSPDALRWLASMARAVNPLATVVPGSGVNAAQAVQSELDNLKTLMGDSNSEYWKGPKSEAHQKRFRELVSVQAKIK